MTAAKGKQISLYHGGKAGRGADIEKVLKHKLVSPLRMNEMLLLV